MIYIKHMINCLVSASVLCGYAVAAERSVPIEKKILSLISSNQFESLKTDKKCTGKTEYQVCLIDNFTQDITTIPEVRSSHGEMVKKMLQSGRDDINIVTFNTGLGTGLAMIIDELLNGGCVDAVVSSAPGSNYTYDQVSTVLSTDQKLGPENILQFRERLRQRLYDIAFKGFPSVEWLEQLDVNSIKLKNDAVKYVFLEALGELNIPVILPYGNPDTKYKGMVKAVNLLSLANNAKVYSALSTNGDRIHDFPYSPLISGEEQAEYDIMECPHPEDPLKAQIDINNDGFYDYVFLRSGRIPYHDKSGKLDFAPPVISNEKFEEILTKNSVDWFQDKEYVLTKEMFAFLNTKSPEVWNFTPGKPYIWINSKRYGTCFEFQAQCRKRGKICGTSVIPPNKVKELLPPK